MLLSITNIFVCLDGMLGGTIKYMESNLKADFVLLGLDCTNS